MSLNGRFCGQPGAAPLQGALLKMKLHNLVIDTRAAMNAMRIAVNMEPIHHCSQCLGKLRSRTH
eukprot:1361353-Pyramimonas_sp.AAC.1